MMVGRWGGGPKNIIGLCPNAKDFNVGGVYIRVPYIRKVPSGHPTPIGDIVGGFCTTRPECSLLLR